MFRFFGKKGKSLEKTPKMPDVLHFKDSQGAFEYTCKYFKTEIREKQALTAIVLDPEKESDVLQLNLESMTKGENVYNGYLVKVSSTDGGFKTLGLCYNKKALIKAGDLILWVPMQNNPAFAMLSSDKRAAWIGGIVAKLAPSYSVSGGSFEILERYA